MLLENILDFPQLDARVRETIWLVVQQINLLLCLVNDVLDMKLIESNRFDLKEDVFSTAEVFSFVLNMFAPQAKI